MRLVKGQYHQPGMEWRVKCVGHGHVGNRSFSLSKGYADLDGEAFVDYYCDKCAAKLEKT